MSASSAFPSAFRIDCAMDTLVPVAREGAISAADATRPDQDRFPVAEMPNKPAG